MVQQLRAREEIMPSGMTDNPDLRHQVRNNATTGPPMASQLVGESHYSVGYMSGSPTYTPNKQKIVLDRTVKY